MQNFRAKPNTPMAGAGEPGDQIAAGVNVA